MKAAAITILIDTLFRTHGATASYLETVPVYQTFDGVALWDAEVHVFSVYGHPSASRAYGWSIASNSGRRFMTALHIPPVDGPIAAVRETLRAEKPQL